jgi:hypothetical protein
MCSFLIRNCASIREIRKDVNNDFLAHAVIIGPFCHIIMGFENRGAPFYMRAHKLPGFTTDMSSRARKYNDVPDIAAGCSLLNSLVQARSAKKKRDFQNMMEALTIEGRLPWKAMQTTERAELPEHEDDSPLPNQRFAERF